MIEKKTAFKLLLISLTLFISMMSVLKDGFSMSETSLTNIHSSFPSSSMLMNQSVLESTSSGPTGPFGPTGSTGPSTTPTESTISIDPNEMIKATISTPNIAHDISTAVLSNPVEQSVIQAAAPLRPSTCSSVITLRDGSPFTTMVCS